MRWLPLALGLCLTTAVGQIPLPPKADHVLHAYFAATSVNTNHDESEYSNEVEYGITNTGVRFITLAWDAPTNDPSLTYKVYRGMMSGRYTTNFDAGHNLSLTIPLWPPMLTNSVVSVTTTNATNLLASDRLSGPWVLLNRTNFIGTNIHSPQYWRSVGSGKKRPGLFITNWLY